jgi:hypothetical protein
MPPRKSNNYKILEQGCQCKLPENLTKQNYNNNYNKPKKVLISNRIQSQNKTGGGTISYGNFGNLLNAKQINNQIITDLINMISKEEITNNNFNNYLYINNLINSYSNNYCVNNINNVNDSQYEYNEFYNNYYKLQNLLTQQNIYQNNCIRINNF